MASTPRLWSPGDEPRMPIQEWARLTRDELYEVVQQFYGPQAANVALQRLYDTGAIKRWAARTY